MPQIFDAHSLWHLSTIPSIWLVYLTQTRAIQREESKLL